MFHQLKYGMKMAGQGPRNKAMEGARVEEGEDGRRGVVYSWRKRKYLYI